MKKIIIILVCLFSLGIDDNFAQSSIIDPNFIQFPKFTVAPACVSADKGKQYFNTTNNKMYYCNGTSWVDFFALPYLQSGVNNVSGDAGLVHLINTGSGNGLYVKVAGGQNTSFGGIFAGYFNSGENGIVAAAGPNKLAIRTKGGLRFTEINEGAGKVLTSDQVGNATWTETIAFRSRISSSPTLNDGVVINVINFVQDFEVGGDNYNGGFFTAPIDGIYHFSVSVKWGSSNTISNYVETNLDLCDNAGTNCINQAKNKMNNELAPNQTFGVNVQMVTGQKVKVSATQTGPASRNIEAGNSATFFSGHLVR